MASAGMQDLLYGAAVFLNEDDQNRNEKARRDSVLATKQTQAKRGWRTAWLRDRICEIEEAAASQCSCGRVFNSLLKKVLKNLGNSDLLSSSSVEQSMLETNLC